MFAFAAGVFGLILIGFIAVSAAVAYHLRRYSVPGDRTALLRRVFLIGGALFFAASLLLFFAIPWSEIRLR